MPIQVLMPQLGEAVLEGTITRWLKARGDVVEEFEPLLEVNTDKVDTEIPSPAAGVLTEILVSEGTTVKIGVVLATIEDKAAPADVAQAPEQSVETPAISAPPPAPPPATAPASPASTATPGRDRTLGFISPVVAKIASENGIDLRLVKGTGEAGRITKKDLLAHLEEHQAQAPAQQPGAAMPALVAAPVPAPPAAPVKQPEPASAGGQIQPLSAVRKAIADHMVYSKHTSPHVTTIMEVDLSTIVAHRQANKEGFARQGLNLTFTAYFISAAVASLKAYPIVNSSWTEQGILLHGEINMGMATSLGEAGLIVPVIKNAGDLSLAGLARAINDLANRARTRQLRPDEVKGGTFTITNHGTSGSLFATPIINQPQCAILSVGAIQKRVVVIETLAGDSIAIRPMVYMGLTFDHRILDGAIADHFLSKVVESLQNGNLWG
jgi:2-oxoglutarate dehydrogenase E2 component (dihydrolipoamide succinyltransferase)